MNDKNDSWVSLKSIFMGFTCIVVFISQDINFLAFGLVLTELIGIIEEKFDKRQ